jgi:hypothetical protein
MVLRFASPMNFLHHRLGAHEFAHSNFRRFTVKVRSIAAPAMRCVLALFVFLLPFAAAFAQDVYTHDQRIPSALISSLFGVFGIGILICYVYMALAVQTIATKTNTENAWLAWIPVVNIILLLNIAKKPVWWFILFLIPLVNIIIAILVWMGVAEARKKPNWWGILLIIPVVGIIVPGYLAWSD